MGHFSHDKGVPTALELVVTTSFLLALLIYILAALVRFHYRERRFYFKSLFFLLGIACVATTMIGPLARRSHDDFIAHMYGHLLLGMTAPLFFVLAAPKRLLLGSLPIAVSRQLTRLLKSQSIQLLHDPMAAAILNVGGLWILYTTRLYVEMQHNVLVHALIHFHIFTAGYLFTAAIIYFDLTPHRTSFKYRTIVLTITFAAHSILAKHIYSHPPQSVSTLQAEYGAMVMYYGGDAITGALILIFCFQWFKSARFYKYNSSIGGS